MRFGSIPVEKEPLGWDRKKGFEKLFPRVKLPFQIVERVSFGNRELEPNRLIWGDNLHVMRQLPSESIDLIYIDPPFFSGRQYNIIFGDQNEVRSFSDIWEGGMPGYLIWLNARLYEMKRLLKKTGSIYVHCDWHASHYIKVEMDKIFGYENLINEVIWYYRSGGGSKRHFGRKHDTLLFYAKDKSRYLFYPDAVRVPYDAVIADSRKHLFNVQGKVSPDVWDISRPPNHSKEWLGYPTQKPEALIERVIQSATKEGDVVADFFCGGGTTPAVAQRLGRRWIACDQSRVAVAVTADRLIRGAQQLTTDLQIPDFTIEYWGVYEARRLTRMPAEQFREFILRCFGARPSEEHANIHGYKGVVPVWVGSPQADQPVTPQEVLAFANAVRRTPRYQQGSLREGIMLAWAFSPEARDAAEKLRSQEQVNVNFIRLDLIRIDSPQFRRHVAELSTDHADYENFLTFVQPPRVEVGYQRIAPLTYKFDVSDTVVVNPNAKILNVQWDFDYDGRHFRSTQGYALAKASEPVVYKFPRPGVYTIACKVQDDKGGEGMWVGKIEVY
ncbi:adenine-specific DNA-methyltransferase [Armatimonadetes bacterium GBS]|nr:adenine-specific DNA-methyltransferase [Armatimonadetes bacterium GBS]